MKIWSVKTTIYSLESIVVKSFTSAAFVKASCIPTCWINYLCEKLKSWFNNQFLKKKKKTEQKERDLNIIENFKIESRYLKLCYQSRAFIRCVKAAFYWPDYQNFSVCPLIKRLDRGFILKNAVEPLKHSAELLTV